LSRSLVIAVALAFLAAAASAQQSVHMPTGRVLDIDMKIADSRLGEGGVIFTSSDLAGVYRFRPVAGGEWVEMGIDAFAEHVKGRLSDATLREKPQLQDWIVRHTAADGRAWLWRAGLKKPVAGRWELRRRPVTFEGKAFESLHLCFSSPALAGFPFAKADRDGWLCDPAGHVVAYPEYAAEKGYERRPGDPFGLSAGKVPYVLKPDTRPEWPEATR